MIHIQDKCSSNVFKFSSNMTKIVNVKVGFIKRIINSNKFNIYYTSFIKNMFYMLVL